MAAIPAAAWVALASTAVTAGTQYASSKQQDINERAAAVATARRAEAAAKESEAAGQLKANEARKRADIMASRALAVAAASGAGTAGIENLMSGFAEEGERSAGYAEYESVESAKGLRDRSAIDDFGVRARAQVRKVDRAATVVGAAGRGYSIYSKYGAGGPEGND